MFAKLFYTFTKNTYTKNITEKFSVEKEKGDLGSQLLVINSSRTSRSLRNGQKSPKENV